MLLMQASNAANAVSDIAQAEVSPELTWFFGGFAALALVLTWLWLWMRVKEGAKEREKWRAIQDEMDGAAEAEDQTGDNDAAEKSE